MEEQVSIETIVCFPHNQFRFKYKINDGSFHFIDKWKALDFFSKHLPNVSSKRKTLQNLLHSFLPFIIIPNLEQVFELKKSSDSEKLTRALSSLTESELGRIKQALDDKTNPETLPNDNLRRTLEDQILGISKKTATD